MNASVKAARPLNILLVVDSYFPGNGGTEAQVQLLAELLAARGHRVEVLAPHLDRKLPLEEVIRGIPVRRLPYPDVKLLGALWLIGKFAGWLLLNRHRYDAIHIHMAKNMAAAAGLVQKWLRGPVMVKISGAWEFEGGVLDPLLQKKLLVTVLNRYIRKLAFVQAISEKTRLKLLAAGYSDSRIQMIPNAVDVARFDAIPTQSSAPGAPVRVIYVGRLQPVKGVMVLIEAWSIVAAAVNAKLTIVGDGPLRGELEQSIERLKLSSSVELVGRSNDVPRLLRHADIYVQPSFQEGLPNSVLEAMSAELPIVATRVSGNEDLVIEGVNGKLVEPGQPAHLAERLIEMIANPSQARLMGLASRRAIDAQYHSQRVIGLLELAYSGVRVGHEIAGAPP